MPTEIDVVERRIRQLEIERVALAKETDAASAERLDALDEELANLQERSAVMKAHWQAEKDAIGLIRDLKEQLEAKRSELEREGDLEKAAEIRYGQLPELERRMGEATKALDELQASEKMLKEEVDEEDIAEVVSKWTGVPVSRLMEGEMQKLVRLEEVLHERVVGQDEAVTAVANAIRRSRAGLSDPHRPIGTFLFLGPDRRGQDRAGPIAGRLPLRRRAGHGPHRHERVHGEALREPADRCPSGLRRLRRGRPAHRGGAAPALRGRAARRDREGPPRRVQRAAAAARRRPAHRRSGPHGRLHQRRAHHDVEPTRAIRSTLFKPEFVNRIDDIVRFRELSQDDLRHIVEIQLATLKARLADRRITLAVTPEAEDVLARDGFDPAFGARPLKRLIQREIGDRLAVAILDGKVADGDDVVVDVGADGELTLA